MNGKPALSATVICSLTLGIGAILGVGPHTQLYIARLLKSSESSIYGTAYSDSLIEFAGISPWIQSIYFSQLMLAALVISICIHNLHSIRSIFLTATLSAFLSITVNDLILAIGWLGTSETNLLENVIANLAGAPILGGVAALLVYCMHSIINDYPENILLRRIAALALPPSIGLLTAISAFYIIVILYNPTPAEISVTLSRDSSAHIWENSKSDQPFNILTNTSRFDGALDINHLQGPLSLAWSSANELAPADMAISILHNCTPRDLDGLKLSMSKSLQWQKIKSISLDAGDGATNIHIPAKNGIISSEEPESLIYWLTKAANDGKDGNIPSDETDIAVFAKNTSLNYSSNNNDNTVYIYSILLDTKTRAKTNKIYNLKINDSKFKLTSRYGESASIDEKASCTQIDASRLDSFNNFHLMDNVGLLGIHIQLIQPNIPSLLTANLFNIKLNDVSGWIHASELENDEAKNLIKEGTIKNIQFRGNIERLVIDGRKQSPVPTDVYTAINAKIKGSYSDRSIYFEGKARQLYKNNQRQNMTRWERMPLEFQIPIIGIFLTLFLYLGNFLIKTLRDNESIALTGNQ